MVALLSQPGATHDEWYHVSSIWCGHGEREPYCPRKVPESGTAIINLDLTNCQKNQETPLLCPVNQVGQSQPVTNFGLYPPVFYFVLSWFVTPWTEASVVVVRIVSALFVSLVLGMLAYLLPRRYRLVMLLMMLTTLTGTGFYLFASINPSSWTALGVGFGWLGIHAGLAPGGVLPRRRVALICAGVLAWVMALGSRWDAAPFVALQVVLLAGHLLWLYFPHQRLRVLFWSIVCPIALALVLQLLTPMKPSRYMSHLFTFSADEPDNVAFISHYFLHGLPNVLRSLGSVPTMSGIVLPHIIFVSGLVILSWFVGHFFNKREYLQSLGAGLVVVGVSLAIMVQVAAVDDRDAFGVEPRYSFPLLPFLIGWWFLFGDDAASDRAQRYIKPAAIVVTGVFGLTMFSVAERFIDVQTYGLRILPEGPDQWWWSWMPVGPNVVLGIAIFAVWMFFENLIADIVAPAHSEVR
jgi:hypothetical protein